MKSVRTFDGTLALLVAALSALSSCSKDVKVQTGCRAGLFNEGQVCDATAECPCGSEGACVAGICRERCGSDADCSAGSSCVKDAIGRGGCLLTNEQSCSAADPCPAPLSCAVDERCRVACSTASPCPSNDQQCLFGACYGDNEGGEKPWLCGDGVAAGDHRCRDGELQSCNTEDLGWSTLAICATQALCEAGLALGGESCVPPSCEAGALDCDGTALLACRDDRTGFDLVDDCKTPGLCKLARQEGRCTTPCGADTEPGAVRCKGAVLEACDADALGWTTVATCASDALCEAGLALGGRSCAPPECEAGVRTCNGTELERCRDDRTGFDREDDCETRGLCREAEETGVCGAPCAPGGECRGEAIWLCREDGTGFDESESCVSGAACLGGAEPRCTSGSTDVLDDFEDGDLSLLAHGGRAGSWVTVSDTFAGVDVANEPVSGRGGSRRALRIGVSEGGYGIVTAANFGRAQDLSEHAGVLFWATKLNGAPTDREGGPELTFRALDAANTDVGSGGVCDQQGGDECWMPFRAAVPVDFTWQAFGYRWDQLAQDPIPWGDPATPSLDAAAVIDLGLEGTRNASYAIDDVVLLRDSVATDCDPGALFCDGPVLRSCNAQGNRDTLVDVCRTEKRCATALELGHCPEECATGTGTCRGKELWRCASSGDGLEFERACAVAEDCVPGPQARCLSDATITSFETPEPLLPRNRGRRGVFYAYACNGGPNPELAFARGARHERTSPWAADARAAAVDGTASLLDYLPGVDPGVLTVVIGQSCGGIDVRLFPPSGAPVPYDASVYQGIRFRARSRSADAVPDVWRFMVGDTTTAAEAGLCGTGNYPPCYAELGVTLADLTAAWKAYSFQWQDLEASQVQGAATTLDPSQLLAVRFNVSQPEAAEIEVDDLEFIE